jgi:Ser/Thr protein kinase RdoA (MazF antagonist)
MSRWAFPLPTEQPTELSTELSSGLSTELSAEPPAATDGPLPGGTANRGRVVRVGDTVHRPRGGYSAAVHALLGHLSGAGFAAAPRVVGGNRQAEVLTYIDGTAATEPLADWALSSAALDSVGRLLRTYHRSAAGFDGTALRWQRAVPTRWRGTLVTHNDTNPANVIFRNGHAVALIDFDLAAPGCAAWELAVAACFWAPLRDEADVADSRRGESAGRLRELLDGYGATSALRMEVVEACVAANDWIAAIIHDASLRGHPAFGRLWAAQAQVYDRADAWIRKHEGQLADALR